MSIKKKRKEEKGDNPFSKIKGVKSLFHNKQHTEEYSFLKGPVLEENEKKKLGQSLDVWANCFYRLENKYIASGPVVDADDYDFLFMIGEGVCHLNDFGSLLISSFERYLDKTKKTDFDDYNIEKKESKNFDRCQEFVNYMRFFNNLICSKVKYFFFRETPVKSVNFPLLEIDKDLVLLGYDLLDLLSGEKINFRQLKIAIAKYFYLNGLMYSFIYDDHHRTGLFLRFSYDKYRFESISEKLKKLTNIYLSEDEGATNKKELKYFLVKSGCLIISDYVEEESKKNKLYDEIRKPKCYNDFYLKALDSSLQVEPFTYRLMDIMWKLNGMLLIGDKNIRSKGATENFFDASIEISNFTKEYLNALGKMYHEGTIDYLQLYNVESRLFTKDGLYKKIFREEPIEEVKNKFTILNNVVKKSKTLKTLPLDIEKINDMNIENVLNKIEYHKESDLKVDVLIEALNPKDLLCLLKKYVDMIVSLDKGFFEKSTQMAGFYRAGVFLSHITNILYSSNKNIWLFNTRPYVATLPTHKENDFHDVENIILIDDNIKTGYTYKLYDSYIKRNNFRNKIDVRMYSLFDFKKYKRISGISANDVKALITVDENKGFELRRFADIKNQLYQNSDIAIKNINIKDTLQKIIDSKGNADIAFVIANTDLFLNICHSFVHKIIEHIKSIKTNKLALFPISVSGSVFSMMTAFLLKLLHEKEVVFVKSGYKIKTGEPIIAIDVSFITGFSLSYNWSIVKNGFYKHLKNQEGTNTIPEEIDLILAVYNGEKIISEKIQSII